jgi:N-alpha-acetyltransferase 38, NatC auxiliary subunit
MNLSSLPTHSSSYSSSSSSAIPDLRSTLGAPYRLSTTDDRVFLGTFACIDKEKNLVLVNADEWRFEQGAWRERYVGMIMVPWEMVRGVECMLGAGGDEELYT